MEHLQKGFHANLHAVNGVGVEIAENFVDMYGHFLISFFL